MSPMCTPDIFVVWFLIQLSLGPGSGKWDTSQRRNSSFSPQLFYLPIAPCLCPVFVDHHPLLTHQLIEGHSWVFFYLKKSAHLTGMSALQKTSPGGKSVELRWEMQTTPPFCWGCLPSASENQSKAASARAASYCTSSHRLPPTDFHVRLAVPTASKAGNQLLL